MEGSHESQGDRRMATTSLSRRRFLATLAAAPIGLGPRLARAATAVTIGTAGLGDYSMARAAVVARHGGFFAKEAPAAHFGAVGRAPHLTDAALGIDTLAARSG